MTVLTGGGRIIAEITGGRGESLPDTARRTGAWGAAPGDTDQQVLDMLAVQAGGPAVDGRFAGPSETVTRSTLTGEALIDHVGRAAALTRGNLFDPARAVDGYVVNTVTGGLFANAVYAASAFIPVAAGQQYTMSGASHWAWYDAAGVFLSGTSHAQSPYTVTAAAGAAWLRVSTIKAAIPVAQYMVVAGSGLPGTYVAYENISIDGGLVHELPGQNINLASIGPERTTFLAPSKNLFNIADPDVALGHFVVPTSGGVLANPAYNATGYVPLAEGEEYTVSYAHSRAFYNASGVHIGGTNNPAPATFVAPAGAVFGRFTVAVGAWQDFQVERGAVATAWVPWGYTLDPDYLPGSASATRSAKFNSGALRQFRYRREKRIREVPEVVRNVIALIGDSFTHWDARWSGGFAATEYADQGDGGGGWVGFGFASPNSPPYVIGVNQPSGVNGNIRIGLYSIAYSGAWTSTYTGVPSPDICCANSSTAGARLVLGCPATPTLSGADLYWIGSADGVMRYSFDAGATWTIINVQGSVGQCNFAALAGVPAAGGTLWLEVVGGTCRPAGLCWTSAANGAVVHKLAATGSQAAHWATQAGNTSWQAAIARLDINSCNIMHGTNDQFAGRSASQLATDLGSIGDGLQAALPGMDIVITMPPENQSGNAIRMATYATTAAEMAALRRWAFCDSQPDFGDPDNPADYGSAGVVPLFSADNVHPDPLTGGRLLESVIGRFWRVA